MYCAVADPPDADDAQHLAGQLASGLAAPLAGLHGGHVEVEALGDGDHQPERVAEHEATARATRDEFYRQAKLMKLDGLRSKPDTEPPRATRGYSAMALFSGFVETLSAGSFACGCTRQTGQMALEGVIWRQMTLDGFFEDHELHAVIDGLGAALDQFIRRIG